MAVSTSLLCVAPAAKQLTIQGGHFRDYNLSALLFAHRLNGDKHVKLEVWSAPGLTKPTFAEAKRASYKSAKIGDKFGPSWVSSRACGSAERQTNHWFKVTVHIPKEFESYERIQRKQEYARACADGQSSLTARARPWCSTRMVSLIMVS